MLLRLANKIFEMALLFAIDLFFSLVANGYSQSRLMRRVHLKPAEPKIDTTPPKPLVPVDSVFAEMRKRRMRGDVTLLQTSNFYSQKKIVFKPSSSEMQ